MVCRPSARSSSRPPRSSVCESSCASAARWRGWIRKPARSNWPTASGSPGIVASWPRARAPSRFPCRASAFGTLADYGDPLFTTLHGGTTVLVDGEVVGAIGVAGNSPAQDAEIARLALQALGVYAQEEIEEE